MLYMCKFNVKDFWAEKDIIMYVGGFCVWVETAMKQLLFLERHSLGTKHTGKINVTGFFGNIQL